MLIDKLIFQWREGLDSKFSKNFNNIYINEKINGELQKQLQILRKLILLDITYVY